MPLETGEQTQINGPATDFGRFAFVGVPYHLIRI
jgi:hypothetical protein